MSPDDKVTPTVFLERARVTAQYLLTVPEADRRKWLRRLAQDNPSYHTLVAETFSRLRSDQKGR